MTNDETTREAEFSAMLQRARTKVLAATGRRPRHRRIAAITTAVLLLIGGGTAAGVAVAGSSGPETYVGPVTIDVPAPDAPASALVVTFTCVDPGEYLVRVAGAPNVTMEGTCQEGSAAAYRFGFMLGEPDAPTEGAQRITVTVPDGARFALESWYQVPKDGTTPVPTTTPPSAGAADPASFPMPDPMTEEQLAALAAAADAQLIAAMQERYTDFAVPQATRERYVLEPEWAGVMAVCLTEAGHPASAEDGGLRNDRQTGLAEDQAWDTAFTACSLRFPMDPRYRVPVNDEQIAFLYDYLVSVAMPYIEDLGGTVSTPPNLTDFTADYRTGDNWSPFWDVSGEFDRDAMLTLPQLPAGFHGAELAAAERALVGR